MSYQFAAVVLGCAAGCFSTEDGPDPTLVFPHPLTITEGATTTFALGLINGPRSDVDISILQGNDYCPTGTALSFAPCRFTPSSDHYPVGITMMATKDDDAVDDMLEAFVYPAGTISALDHDLWVYIVDTDALNVVASNWSLTLAPGATTSFEVQLTQPPAAPMMVAVQPGNDDGLLQLTPTSLTFDATTFDVPQTVVVSGTISESREVYLTPGGGMRWGSVQVSPPIRTVY
jgi:hypothetical protein